MLIGKEQKWPGEDRAWDLLLQSNTDEVCQNAKADFDELSACYVLPLFNGKVYISLGNRQILGDSQIVDKLLNELAQYSRLSLLLYLVNAKGILPSGNLINPRDLSGGIIFTQGTHTLPLKEIAERYRSDVDDFIRQGLSLGGKKANYGDCSVMLFPFPLVPVMILLWRGDDEFTARAGILFDSTCAVHLPTDILWSTAMMSILVMLE